MSNTQRNLLLAAAFTALTLGLATAPARAAQLNRIEIVIKDIESGEDFGTIAPGETVEISGTAKVRLIMTAVYGNGKTIYPYTTYSSEGGGGTITRANPQNGAADLVLNRTGYDEEVSFAIDDERIPDEWSEGSFTVRVGR